MGKNQPTKRCSNGCGTKTIKSTRVITAILDLGTNTFNLLIAEIEKGRDFKTLFFERVPVKLGEQGIASGLIAPPAFKRGLQAIERHHQSIKKYQADQIFAFATSAIRDASNGLGFLDQIENKFNFRPQIISGDREAELIYRGVHLAYPYPMGKTGLIIDIGGGSTEFILANKDRKSTRLNSSHTDISRMPSSA